MVFEVLEGDKNKSGGVAINIGIHFYDMLQFVFAYKNQRSLLSR